VPNKIRARDLSTEQQQKLEDVKAALLARTPAKAPAVDLLKDTLRSRREALGYKTEEVCALCQIAHSSLRNYESGRTKPQFPPDVQMNFLQAYRLTYPEFAALVSNTEIEASASGITDSWKQNQEKQKARKREERAGLTKY
jgi:transcriptional regulator with XRE-family HTH domain